MRLELHPEARAELRIAALWYDERRAGLGDEFIAEVSAAFDRIRGAPESYPAWPGTRAEGPLIRKATTQRFPYVPRSRFEVPRRRAESQRPVDRDRSRSTCY